MTGYRPVWLCATVACHITKCVCDTSFQGPCLPSMLLYSMVQPHTSHTPISMCTANRPFATQVVHTCSQHMSCLVPMSHSFPMSRPSRYNALSNVFTGSTQQHWPFPEHHLGLGYAYILTHPGLPCIAWEHMWDGRLTSIIKQLMALRKRQDIHAGSQLDILCADRRMYVAKIDNR